MFFMQYHLQCPKGDVKKSESINGICETANVNALKKINGISSKIYSLKFTNIITQI